MPEPPQVGHSRECCFFLVSVVVWKEACERFKKEKSVERRRSGERRARVEVHFENSRANVSADPRCPEARGVLLLFAHSAIRQGPARSARSWERSETRERSRPRTSIPEPSPRATTRLFFSSTDVRREHGTVPRPLALWYYSYFYSLSLSYLVCVVFVAREHAGGEERGGGCSCEPGEGERGRRFGGGPCRRRRQQSRRRHRRGGPRAGQRGPPRQEHAGHGELAESA